MRDPFLSSSWHRVAGLRPRLHRHVDVHRHAAHGERAYVLQDKLRGTNHKISADAHEFIARLDGTQTVNEVWRRLSSVSEGRLPSQTAVVRILSQLHMADLLWFDQPPDSVGVVDRTVKDERKRFWRQIGNPLAIKVPLGRPHTLLTITYGLARLLVSPIGGVLWLTLVISAVILALIHAREIAENLSDQDLSARNVALMAVVYIVVKLVHEFGHGAMTRLYGGEVREYGVMLLVGFPMPYVDASDAACFKQRHRRMLVGAAGMLIELALAAIALIVWLAVEPGTLRSTAYAVMLICSVSTLLFNGNPLLRYDGYFILSDWVAIPNLAQAASRYWTNLVSVYLFGSREARQALQRLTFRERLWFFVYAPLSYVYRLFLMVTIALLVAEQLPSIGPPLALLTICGGLIWPVFKGLKHVTTSPSLANVRARAILVTFSLIALVGTLLFAVPVPFRSHAEGIVWLPETAFLRAGTSAEIASITPHPWPLLEQGKVVVTGSAFEIDARVAEQEARVAEFTLRLQAEQFTNRSEAEIQRIELENAESELRFETERQRRLQVRAGADGMLVINRHTDLEGRYVKEGQTVGYVLPSQPRLLRITVAQDHIELVRRQLQGIDVKVPGWLEQTFAGNMLREVPAGTTTLPSKALGLPGGGSIAVDARDPDRTKATQRLFQLEVDVGDLPQPIAFGTRVFVRFDHGLEPLGFRFYRGLRRLLLSRLQT